MKKPTETAAHKIQFFIFHIAIYFELFIALLVIIGLLISLISIPSDFRLLYELGNSDFNAFLKSMFNLIIGVELLKMLCRHDLDSVVEVLLFAVARGMIIEHMPIWQTLIGVVAIAILFMIRKYLFISALDKQEDEPDRKE